MRQSRQIFSVETSLHFPQSVTDDTGDMMLKARGWRQGAEPLRIMLCEQLGFSRVWAGQGNNYRLCGMKWQNFGDRIVQPCSVSRIEWERNKKPLLELQDTDDTDVP